MIPLFVVEFQDRIIDLVENNIFNQRFKASFTTIIIIFPSVDS